MKPQPISKEKIRRLTPEFDLLSANLAQYLPQFSDHFLCPFCGRAFPRTALPWGYISEAHVVPRTLGGTSWTLLCRNCNNSLGSEIESHASRKARANEALREPDCGEVVTRAFVERGGVRADGVLVGLSKLSHKSSQVLKVEFKSGHSPPETTEALSELLTAPDKMRIGFYEPERWDEDRASRMAPLVTYLAMFRTFGYEFVFSRLGVTLRNRIFAPYGQRVQPISLYTSEFRIGELGSVLMRPKPKARFIVVVPNPDNLSEFSFCMLPALTSHYFNYGKRPLPVNPVFAGVRKDRESWLLGGAGILHRQLYGKSFRLEILQN